MDYTASMLEQLVTPFTNIFINTGYPAIFILMFFESLLVPIPSELTMIFGGFLVGTGRMHLWPIVFLGALGNLTGSLIAYTIGYRGQKIFIERFIAKFGKYLLISLEEIKTAERLFKEKGEVLAFLSRLFPIIRSIISLPAGFSKMSIIKFSVFTFLGSLLWSTVLAYLGLKLEEYWYVLGPYFKKFDYLIIGFCFFLLLIYIRYKIRKIRIETS